MSSRWVGQRRVETVQVPVLATEIALDDLARAA